MRGCFADLNFQIECDFSNLHEYCVGAWSTEKCLGSKDMFHTLSVSLFGLHNGEFLPHNIIQAACTRVILVVENDLIGKEPVYSV